MFKKIALLTLVSVFSYEANAGLFDSNDFKCGRDDAIKALSEYIRNDASGQLQNDFITKSRFSYDKPVSTYQDKLNNVGIAVTNVSTGGEGSSGLNCSATIAIKIPQETMDVVSNAPGYLSYITRSYGKINNGSVIWSGVGYSAKLADNKKDILFGDFNRNEISDAMFNISVLATNKDKIINSLSRNTLESARNAYANSDRELNAVWKDLPDSARNAMKKEQVAWVNDKVNKCGKLSDGKLEAIDVKQRISIYQCQAKMTNERIAYLSGNNN